MSLPARPHDRDPPAERRVHVVQGEFQVSARLEVVLFTTLGSCVACCMHDPVARVGGMNHFLLPHGEGRQGPAALRYGAHAMELLINGLLHAGARKDRIEVKLFGGGRQSQHLPDVGVQNVAFAEHFVRHEGMSLLPGSVGGQGARRVQFWPATGRARQLAIRDGDAQLFRAEVASPPPVVIAVTGDVELFGD